MKRLELEGCSVHFDLYIIELTALDQIPSRLKLWTDTVGHFRARRVRRARDLLEQWELAY